MSQSGGVGALVGAVAGRVARLTARGGPVQQTVTVSAAAPDVLAAWRDPGVLARLLGDLGEAERDAAGHYLWTLHAPRHALGHAPGHAAGTTGAAGGESPRTWDTVLVERADGLRFADATGAAPGTSGEQGPHLDVSVHEAPRGMGTEVRLALDLPVPGLLAGATAFTLLYRLRALLQTGEIPTLGRQPSARPGPR